MKVLSKGRSYALKSFESTHGEQILKFIKKEQSDDEGNMKTVYDGTTNEEVLRMMIDRMKYLQDKMPCRENAIVITNLEESLMWLEKRTQDRKERNVEGTTNQ